MTALETKEASNKSPVQLRQSALVLRASPSCVNYISVCSGHSNTALREQKTLNMETGTAAV